MRSTQGTILLFSASILAFAIQVSHATSLCSNPSGSVFVRDQCRANEQSVTAGPAGITGLVIVKHQDSLAPGSTFNVRVDCPSGKKVLGGGFDIETPADLRIFASEPSDGHGNVIDYGWNVMVQNAGASTRQATVTAICATVH